MRRGIALACSCVLLSGTAACGPGPASSGVGRAGAAEAITVNAGGRPRGPRVAPRFSSETAYVGFLSGLAPPGHDYPNVYQRVASAGLDVWRDQAVDGYNTITTTLPFPCNYTSSTGQSVAAWSFTALDKSLSEGPPGVPRELNLSSAPDCMFTGSAPLGGDGSSQGALIDPSYHALGAWAAAIVQYFRAGVLVSGSGGAVSYTATSLTDRRRDFAAYAHGRYSVTATVIDANGFPDWETGAISGVRGPHDETLELAGWSAADSYDATAGDGLLRSRTPARGAAYDLASSAPPPVLSSPEAATPWPRPPSVGDVRYFEIMNEPDLSNYNEPRLSPSLIPPAPALSGVNIPGGALTPGATYGYRITAMDTVGDESLPGREATITLPSGDDAVRLSWSATAHLGLPPSAYRIYGRAPGEEQAMVVVGSTNPGGLSWTDTGAVTPSGAPPTSDTTAGAQLFSPLTYLQMWNVVAPAMKAVDPTIELVGPALSNAKSVCGCSSVQTNAVTTGPNDGSYLSSRDYIPTLMAEGRPAPDVVSFHAYGWYQGTSSNEAEYWAGLKNEIASFVSVDQAAVRRTPVWIDESNIDAGSFGSAPSATDLRAETQMGSAWLADSIVQWATHAPEVKEVFQFEAYSGDASWGMFSSANYGHSRACVPQPACRNIAAEQPNLEYWLVRAVNRWLPAGSELVRVSGIPNGFAAAAFRTAPRTIVLLLVNTARGASDGNGTPDSVTVRLAGGRVRDTKRIVIDGSTSMANGPGTTDLGAARAVRLHCRGYAVTLLKFDLR